MFEIKVCLRTFLFVFTTQEYYTALSEFKSGRSLICPINAYT